MKHLRDPRVWVGLAVTAVCLWLALRDVEFHEVASAFARADWLLLLGVSVPAHLAALLLRALRWRHLTDPIEPIAPGPLFRATAVGFMANNLIPLRVGEVLRAWYLAREVRASGTTLFGTVVLERVIDSAVFLSLLGVILGVYGLRLGAEGLAVGVPLLAILSAPMAFVVALRFWPGPLVRLSGAVLRPVNEPLAARVEAAVASFAEGLGAISRGGHLFWIAWHTAWIWLVASMLPFWVGIVALDLDLGSIWRELAASYVLLTVVGIAVAVPSAPGFFGPYHLACRAALTRFGVPEGQALALGTAVHAIFWVTVTAAGLAVLRLRRTSLQELEEHTELEDLQAAPSPADPADLAGPGGLPGPEAPSPGKDPAAGRR